MMICILKFFYDEDIITYAYVCTYYDMCVRIFLNYYLFIITFAFVPSYLLPSNERRYLHSIRYVRTYTYTLLRTIKV